MLYGYGSIIFDGALVTIEQALLSVVLSFLLGLIGAAAKSSQSKLARLLSGIYTTLIRGVPDLVLMLLIFYGLQIVVNGITESLGIAQLNIDPFAAGVITIAITSDTLVFAGDGTIGSRTLAASGMATAVKITSTRWIISGSGLT